MCSRQSGHHHARNRRSVEYRDMQPPSGGGGASNLDARADFNQTIHRNREVSVRALRVTRQEREKLVPPDRHAGIRRYDGVPADEERHRHWIEIQAFGCVLEQAVGDVRVLGKTEACCRTIETGAEVFELELLVGASDWRIQHLGGQDHVLFVQYLVVLEIVQQRLRNAACVGGEENRKSGYMNRWMFANRADERIQRQTFASDALQHQIAPLSPGRHYGEDHETQYQWEPTPALDLDRIGCEERQINANKG